MPHTNLATDIFDGLTLSLTSQWFAEAFHRDEAKIGPTTVSSGRSEFARACYLYACIFRSDTRISLPERFISKIDEILFFPLDASNQIGYQDRRCESGHNFEAFHAGPLEARKICNGFFPRSSKTEPDSELRDCIRTVRLGTGERPITTIPAQLMGHLQKNNPAPARQMLVVEQRTSDSPDYLIVLVSRTLDSDFSSQDEVKIATATQLFFSAYRTYRLQAFTRAYRDLVDQRLLLQVQNRSLVEIRQHFPTTRREPMAALVAFFCRSLLTTRALPEMDGALFYPLVGAKYYLYRAPRKGLDSLGDSFEVKSLRSGGQWPSLPDLEPLRNTDRDGKAGACRTLFEIRHLHIQALAAASQDLSLLRQRARDLHAVIQHFLELTDQRPHLIGQVEGGLFESTRWDAWAFHHLEPKFLGGIDREQPGSLLVLTVLFDHLPLGMLFLASRRSHAFGPEDLIDVRAIAKAYFQTFQLETLRGIVESYQALGKRLRPASDSVGSPARASQAGFGEFLGRYVDSLFEGFATAQLAAWIPFDRDDFYYGTRDQALKDQSLQSLLKSLASTSQDIERLQASLYEITRAIPDLQGGPAQPAGGDTSPVYETSLRWLYCWALFQASKRGKLPEDYPQLDEIPQRLLEATTGREVLGAHLALACYPLCVLDDELPYLRRLLLEAGVEADLIPSTGSFMTLAVFYDALPKGLLILGSPDELSFTPEIELRDFELTARAYLLPALLDTREQAVRGYQTLLLGENSGGSPADEAPRTVEGFRGSIETFFHQMLDAIPTLESCLFLPLNSDSVFSCDAQDVSEWWPSSELRCFGRGETFGLFNLEAELRDVETRLGRGVESRLAYGSLALRRLYLRSLRDLVESRQNPRDYGLQELVEELFSRSGAGRLSGRRHGRAETDIRLRSYVHASHWSICDLAKTFPGLPLWFETETEKPEAERLKRWWENEVSLIAVLLLNEGRPYGILFLASSIRGSFTEQERRDVEAAAKVYFRDGQIAFRDEIILDYRNIVANVLSEDSLISATAALSREGHPLAPVLAGDELGAFLAYFMEILLESYGDDPTTQLVFFPFSGDSLYVGASSSSAAGPLRLRRFATSNLELPGIAWSALRRQWLRDTVLDLRPDGALEVGEEVETDELLTELHQQLDRCLATFLYPAQRFGDILQIPGRRAHSAAYLALFQETLGTLGVPWKTWRTGSLMTIPILLPNLPAAGLLTMSCRIPWRYSEHDQLDVEAVARAYFFTYRAILLKREATEAARLSGMRQMLLGVTHRLKNDLQPTFNTISKLHEVRHQSSESIGRQVQLLDRNDQIETGAEGIEQVRNKFAMLRSIVSGGRQPKKSRSLATIATTFAEQIHHHKRRLAQTLRNFDPASIQLVVGSLPEPLSKLSSFRKDCLVSDLESLWVDVSEGVDEVLSIYAENAVRAVADEPQGNRQISLLFLFEEGAEEVELGVFDGVVIPEEKLTFIQKGEVIPTEVGGGSGTGFHNAGNLLKINNDGAQVIKSGGDLGGTLIRLRMPVLVARPYTATGLELRQHLEWLLEELSNRYRESSSQGGIQWKVDTSEWRDQQRLRLYQGTYHWKTELLNLPLQVFLQRHLNEIERNAALFEGEDSFFEDEDWGLGELSSVPSEIHIVLRSIPDEGLAIIMVGDQISSRFYEDFVEEAKQLDQIERRHNRPSLLGPEGSLGELFLIMIERLTRRGISIRTESHSHGSTISIEVMSSQEKS